MVAYVTMSLNIKCKHKYYCISITESIQNYKRTFYKASNVHFTAKNELCQLKYFSL